MRRKRNGFTIWGPAVIIVVIAVLASVLMPAFRMIVSKVQDREFLRAAENAYAQHFINCAQNKIIAEYYLYDTAENRVVAVHNGAAVGVYSSHSDALKALLDDPKTNIDESLTYSYFKLADSDLNRVFCKEVFSGLTYTSFGDSITQGYDGFMATEKTGYFMSNPYPKIVLDILGLHTIDNPAQCGATLCPVPGLTNMTDVIATYTGTPHIISVMMGVNDYQNDCPLGDMNSNDRTTVYGCLKFIAEHLTKNYPDAFVFFMTPFQKEGGEKSNDRGYVLSDVAEAVKTVAEKYNVPVLDMYTLGRYELEMYLDISDGIHPSQQHHMNYTAPLICEFFLDHYPAAKTDAVEVYP